MRPVSKPKVAPPKTLADALEMGLRDLRAVERNTTVYRVVMAEWHKPNSHCAVCLAGAVMAKTCGADPAKIVYTDQFGDKWQGVFYALDDLRGGHVYSASLSLNVGTVVSSRSVPGYSLDHEGWWKAMHQLLKELKAEQAARK